MQKSRRKFMRSAVPFAVRFRPTYGAIEYYPGTAGDLSCQGLRLDAHDFRFILYEYLELVIEPQDSGHPVSLFGDIVWKKQDGKGCAAGIKFRMKDKRLQESLIQQIFISVNIPLDRMYSSDTDYPAIYGKAVSPADQDINLIPENKLGIIRQYHENGNVCRVTFRLLGEIARKTEHATIVGDFNDWDITRSPMTRLRNGDFVIAIDLPSRGEYRFRYLLDGQRWENDLYADRFVKNRLGSKVSVVIV